MSEYGCKCDWCKRNPKGEDGGSDEWFDAFLRAHPMDPVTEENVEASVQRLRKRLRAKPGPTLNL